MLVRHNGNAAERQVIAGREVRGKSELRRAVRRLTAGRGDPKESGTENIPPFDSPLRGSLRAGPHRAGLEDPLSAGQYWACLERTPKG